MKKYYRKSFYKGLDDFVISKVIFLILQLICVFGVEYNRSVAFCGLNIIVMIYFVTHIIFIQKQINMHNATIAEIHNERMNIHKGIVILYVIISLFFICVVIKGAMNFEMWWWIGSVSISLYSESVTLSAVIAFGKDGYVSGDYFIRYCDIDEIREEKGMNTTKGKILLITLWKDGKEVGFDKMFIEEYHKLRLQVYQN